MELKETTTNIEVKKNGPLRVMSDFITILNSDGNEIQKEQAVSFCRCGKSMKQPFCDGAHKELEPFE